MRLMMLMLVSALMLTSCSQPDPEGLKEVVTQEVTIDGRVYLAQWLSNGHRYQWQIVAGPIK